jgi:hypothetical protein
MTPCRVACLALVSVWMGAAPVLAQMRSSPIPANAKLGHIRHVEAMAVTVSKRPMQLAVGATIRNQMNLIIVPVGIPREGAWAAFTLDRSGQISQVWLLTPEELAQARKRLGGGKS